MAAKTEKQINRIAFSRDGIEIPANYVCKCGVALNLVPHRDYMGDEWAGCSIRGAQCAKCPLEELNGANLKAAVIEVFGP